MSSVDKKATKEDWIKFTIVMIVFIIGMIFMMIHQIKNIWLWIAYVIIWTWVEMKIAKNIHLKWWTWMFIILALCVLDFIIIKLIPH